jgi:hypothetical protein
MALNGAQNARDHFIKAISVVVTQLATRVATLEIEASELEDALARGNALVTASADSSTTALRGENSQDSDEHSSDAGAEFITGVWSFMMMLPRNFMPFAFVGRLTTSAD